MKHDSQYIDLLITRFLSGEAGKEELRELDKWMESSEANRKYFEQSRFIFEKAKAHYKYKNYDADQGWQSLQVKIKTGSVKGTKIRTIQRSSLGNWMRIAAGILIVIGIASVFFLLQKPVPEVEIVSLTSTTETINKKLADNSEVVLNKNSKITYSKEFGKKDRKVLLSGEAYFKVEHKEELPFMVDVGGVYIKDVGTAFNIKAYPESALVEIFVESGIVEFYTDQHNGLTLHEGESAMYNRSDSSFSVMNKSAENLLAYKTRIFRFNNTPLNDVVSQLNSVYNQEVRILNKNLGTCRITVTFEDENIDNIVQVISETLNLQVLVDDRGFALKGNTCSNE